MQRKTIHGLTCFGAVALATGLVSSLAAVQHMEQEPAESIRTHFQAAQKAQREGDLLRAESDYREALGVSLEELGLIEDTRGDLDKAALMQILTEPKNALIRQYQRLFEFENVRLRFSDDALETVAELALQRKVGARGLRMILEDLMLELMYHLPAQRKLREFVVTGEMVRSREINWSLLEKAG